MIGYVFRRVCGMVLTLLVICAVTFAIFYVLPADPAVSICGKACTAERIVQIREQLGLNEPLLVQFKDYLFGIFAGRSYGTGATAVECSVPCLGFSYQNNLPVWDLLVDRLPVSASIAIGAAVLWLVAGVTAGVISAVRKGSIWDRSLMVLAFSGVSLPIYFTALLMLYYLVIKLDVLPFPTYVSPLQDPVSWAVSLLMPWVALAFLYAALYARLTRSGMLETMGENFIRTARAKGLKEHSVITRHGLRAAITPVVTVFGIDLGSLIGGTLITETVFGLPGVGKLTYDAITKADLPIILGVTLLSAFFIIVANLIVDLTYALLDPKVRYGQ